MQDIALNAKHMGRLETGKSSRCPMDANESLVLAANQDVRVESQRLLDENPAKRISTQPCSRDTGLVV